MDKYIGVYVKLLLNNNEIVKGHIYGRDDQGLLLLKDAVLERANKQKSHESILPISTREILDLEVLEDNTVIPARPSSVQQNPQHPMQQSLPQPLYNDLSAPNYSAPAASGPLMNHTVHLDPAVLFQQRYSMPPQQPQLAGQTPLNDPTENNRTNDTNGSPAASFTIDPAILFTQCNTAQSPPLAASMSGSRLRPLDPSVLFQQSSSSNSDSTDGSSREQQQQQQKGRETMLQDPAIVNFSEASISAQNKTEHVYGSPKNKEKPPQQQRKQISETPECKEHLSRKPLFGNCSASADKKAVKEVVEFEDYLSFENNNGVVTKTATSAAKKRNKKEDGRSNSDSSKAMTSMQQQCQAQPAVDKTMVDPSMEMKQHKQKKQQQPKPLSNIPTSLIPPHVLNRRTEPRSALSSKQDIVDDATLANIKPPQPTAFTSNMHKAVRITTVSGGIEVPTVNAVQMEASRLIARDIGFGQTQIVENAAFGISTMVLKAIGGHRRIQPDNHNSAPVTVILVGSTAVGEYGIAAARHLANRGCQVIISMTENSYSGASVEQYKALAKFSGAQIVYSVADLPDPCTMPVDIIVDALLGSDMLKITPAIKQQMQWANNNKAPVLSIEFPSGVNPNDGCPPANTLSPDSLTSDNAGNAYITPKWTLCLGAPFNGCVGRHITGELFLADTGLPSHCFEKNSPGFHIPWGSEFVLALEYDEKSIASNH